MSDQSGNPPEQPTGGPWPPAYPPGYGTGAPAYGQPPGPGPAPGYGPPGQPSPYGYGYGPGPSDLDSRATTAMILGILGLVLCPFTAPFAWSMGKKVLDEARRRGQPEPGPAKAGLILGILGSVIALLFVVWFAIVLVTMVSSVSRAL